MSDDEIIKVFSTYATTGKTTWNEYVDVLDREAFVRAAKEIIKQIEEDLFTAMSSNATTGEEIKGLNIKIISNEQ